MISVGIFSQVPPPGTWDLPTYSYGFSPLYRADPCPVLACPAGWPLGENPYENVGNYHHREDIFCVYTDLLTIDGF